MKAATRLLIASLLMVAVGCSQADSETARAPEPAQAEAQPVSQAVATAAPAASRPRIVFLGDSLTAGLGLDPADSIPSLVQAHLDSEGYDYEVVNAGVSGDTSAGGLRRLDWSLDGPVALLVLELGANDGLRGLPVPAMKRNLEAIITEAKRRGIRVLLTGMEAPPNYGVSYTSQFRQAFVDLAREQKVDFFHFFLEGVAGDPTLNQADGMHPNPQGARIVERTLWTALRPLLHTQDQ